MGTRMLMLAVLLLAVVLFLLPGTGHCNGSEKQVGLKEAIITALADNHEIRALKNSLLAQKADVGVARSLLLPKIAFEERVSRTNNPPGVFMMKLNQERFSQSDFAIGSLNNPKPSTDLQTLFSIEQPVFAPKAFIGLTMAKKEYSAQSQGFNRKKEEIALKVAHAYLQVRTAKAYISVAGRALDDAKEHGRVAEARYRNGLGLFSDTLRATTAIAASEQKMISAGKNLAVAKRMLGLLLGVSEPVDAGEEAMDITLRETHYYESGALSRQDVKALQMRHENARTSVRLAESMYLPTVGVGGAYQLNDHARLFGSEGESWRLMAALRWELFDGTNREFERSKALYRVAEAEEHLKGLKELVSFRIHEALLAVEEARKNAELSRAALKTAEEGRRLVKTRYENSLSPVIDLLDVQINLDQSRANAVARENEYQFSVINLSYEAGTILRDLAIE